MQWAKEQLKIVTNCGCTIYFESEWMTFADITVDINLWNSNEIT